MCGIVAVYSRQEPICERDLHAGVEMLRHRGPEHQGVWVSDDRRVALGHSRLSIIDLHTGEQPIANSESNAHIIANGEFYDHERIRTQLETQGYQFKTQSDSEIALHLYQEYGASCLHQLRGEFAFCIWDEANQMLFAARDRFGIKPLFFSEYQGKVYLGSEIKAILAAGVPVEWDQESYRTRAFTYRDRTLFKNIHQVPPGHYLIATQSGVRLIKYWDFDYPQEDQLRTTPKHSESQIISDVREKIVEAIRLRLRADVPVGVYLSGGIDSSAVLGIASELHENNIDTFTLSFENESYDELAIAEATAKHVGASFNPIKISSEDLADNFSDTIWHCENTCVNAHTVAKFLLSKAVQKSGYKVVLTGEGADEVFAGYPPFRQDAIYHNGAGANDAVNKLYSENSVSAGLLLDDGHDLSPTALQIKKMLGFMPSWLSPQIGMIEAFVDLYRDQFGGSKAVSEPLIQFLIHSDINNQVLGRNPVHVAMYLMSKSLLPNYILTMLGDRVEMAHSIEGRTPFLDHKLVEYIVGLPIDMKIRGMTEKYVLREATKPWLTEEVYRRQKHPFLAPPAILKPDEKLYQYAQDTFNSQSARDQPFYDMDKVKNFTSSIIKQDIKFQVSAEPILMEILSLCTLQNRYGLSAAVS